MSNSTAAVQIEMLQHQLILFKTVYEEMITNENEFDALKPILLRIRQLEKAMDDIRSHKAESLFVDTPKVAQARFILSSLLHLIRYFLINHKSRSPISPRHL
jgi:hypothetical protein